MAAYAMHVWVNVDQPSPGFSNLYGCLDYFGIGTGSGADSVRRLSTFFEEAIYNGMGPDTLLGRVNQYLEGAGPWNWNSLDDLAPTMNMLFFLFESSPQQIVPHLINHQTLSIAFNIGKKASTGRTPEYSFGYFDPMFNLFA